VAGVEQVRAATVDHPIPPKHGVPRRRMDLDARLARVRISRGRTTSAASAARNEAATGSSYAGREPLAGAQASASAARTRSSRWMRSPEPAALAAVALSWNPLSDGTPLSPFAPVWPRTGRLRPARALPSPWALSRTVPLRLLPLLRQIISHTRRASRILCRL